MTMSDQGAQLRWKVGVGLILTHSGTRITTENPQVLVRALITSPNISLNTLTHNLRGFGPQDVGEPTISQLLAKLLEW